MQLETGGEAMTRPAAVLAGPILTGVALNLALVVLAIVRYPAIFGAERVPFVLVDVAILLGYAAAAVAVARIADEGTVGALRSATWLGLVAGVLQGLEIVREDLVAAERVTALVTGLVSLLAMFALFGLAGVLAGAGPRGGALAGIWCAMTAMMALWLMAWGLTTRSPTGSRRSGLPTTTTCMATPCATSPLTRCGTPSRPPSRTRFCCPASGRRSG
jgi:hypothetical protein